MKSGQGHDTTIGFDNNYINSMDNGYVSKGTLILKLVFYDENNLQIN